MANETTKSTGRQSAAKEPAQTVTETADEKKRSFIPKEIDPHMIVTVRNGFQGRLVYKSRKTGERFVWETFGAEQDMEIGELRNAKSANKKYFINNWFMFDDPWIPDYLGMAQYYKFAIPIEDFDKFFEKPAEEIEKAVAKLSDGQKQSVAYRAKQLIADKAIDSIKAVEVLEKGLGVELIERDK